MLTQMTRGLRRRMNRDDSGFTLIEVVVAFVVLAIFSSALMVTLLNGLKVSKVSRERVAASNLAAREVEIVRNKFQSSGGDALTVASQTSVTNQNPLTGAAGTASVIDGVPYTVVRTAEWQPTGTGVSACDGGGAIDFPALKVSVNVTWPKMGTAKPVHADTIMTPLKGQLADDSLTFFAVKVTNATPGGVTTGVRVTATGPGGSFSDTTDAKGCAVLQVTAPGSYTIGLNTTGFVDQTGVQNSTITKTVSAGSLVQASMTYDLAASMNVSITVPTGYTPPTAAGPSPTLFRVNFQQPNVPVSGSRRTVDYTATPTRIDGLWPQTAGYSSWAGGCTDSDPSSSPTTGGSRGTPVVIPAGTVGNVSAALAGVTITARSSAVTTIPNGTIRAINTSGCTTGDSTLVLGVTDASGVLKAALPYGTWRLTITSTALGTKNATSSNLIPTGSGPATYTLRTY